MVEERKKLDHHIRVITPLVTESFRSDHELQGLQRPGLRISQATIQTGPASIESEFDEALSLPGTIGAALAAQRDGVNALVIDCMGDPAVNACREVVDIPVLGPGTTSMHIAALLSLRFSVVTVLASVVPMIWNLARIAGLADRMASVRAIEVPVLEIEADPARLRESLARESELAIRQDGAHGIVLGCTGFFGCAEALSAALRERKLDVPVIDPVPATIRFAAALLEGGLAQSRITYPPPRRKQLKGYDLRLP
jgi:allantoin racemase